MMVRSSCRRRRQRYPAVIRYCLLAAILVIGNTKKKHYNKYSSSFVSSFILLQRRATTTTKITIKRSRRRPAGSSLSIIRSHQQQQQQQQQQQLSAVWDKATNNNNEEEEDPNNNSSSSSTTSYNFDDDSTIDTTAWFAVDEEDATSNYCVLDYDDMSQPFQSITGTKLTFIEYTADGSCVYPAGPIGQFKERIGNGLIEPSVEIVIALVVLFNSLLVALSTFDTLINSFASTIQTTQIIIGTIFLLDFIARWFSSTEEQFKFVLNIQFGIDLLVVILPLAVTCNNVFVHVSVEEIAPYLPSALSHPSALVNLQLLRVLRLRRFLEDLETFDKFFARAFSVFGTKQTTTRIAVQDWQLQLARVALSLFTLISVASGLIYTAEQDINPNINNYFDALYFGLTTLTTVGFGDIAPVTWQGRLVVLGSIVLGVVIVPAQAAQLLEALLDREENMSSKNSRSGSSGSTSTSRNTNKRALGRIGTFEGRRTPHTTISDTYPSTATTTALSRFDNHAMDNNDDDDDDAESSLLALNTKVSCENCGVSFHWSSARYCYNCGNIINDTTNTRKP